jgi:hypothetical protein
MAALTSISPVLKRASDLSREVVRKRASLKEIQKRLGTHFEKPGDFERVRHLAHALGGLDQGAKLADYLLDSQSASYADPTRKIKRGQIPDFDLDDTIEWVGRTI